MEILIIDGCFRASPTESLIFSRDFASVYVSVYNIYKSIISTTERWSFKYVLLSFFLVGDSVGCMGSKGSVNVGQTLVVLCYRRHRLTPNRDPQSLEC